MPSLRVKYFLIFFICTFVLSRALKLPSIEKSYNKGVEAYARERWSECIANFEEALHLYKLYKTININCRLKCMTQEWKSKMEDIEDIKVYEKFLNTRLCIIKCQRDRFDETRISDVVPESILKNMQTKKPYEFLHICYFQMYLFPKAASAAYTYLAANPSDTKMENNVKYYIDMPEVDVNEVMDLESEDFKIFYGLGIKEYNLKKWGETIANIEEALTDYISWENMCRAECQHQSELEWSPEFTTTVSNYMLSLLLCKQKCQEKLKSLDFDSGQMFLADLLNYLQISYYNIGRIEDAAKAVQTYLLILPNDEDMLSNKQIYTTLTDKENFIERSDVSYYLKRDKNEKIFLDLYFNSDTNNEVSLMKE